MKKRMKNPFFWSGVAGLVWTVWLGKQGWITNDDYKLIVDLIAFGFIGKGIYTNFPSKENEGEKA